MGMGEPMMNLDAVLAACDRLPDIGITNRRTGISTVGWVPGIKALTERRCPIRLAFSLHAPDDVLRSELMPVNDRYPLADVLAACERYHDAPQAPMVFVEYVMLDGVNDRARAGAQLADLLDPRIYKVNLIPYNPTGSGFEGSARRRSPPSSELERRGCPRPCASPAAGTSTPRAASWPPAPRAESRHPSGVLPGAYILGMNARKYLFALKGRTLYTVGQGKPNRIIAIDKETVTVGTEKSPDGTP